MFKGGSWCWDAENSHLSCRVVCDDVWCELLTPLICIEMGDDMLVQIHKATRKQADVSLWSHFAHSPFNVLKASLKVTFSHSETSNKVVSVFMLAGLKGYKAVPSFLHLCNFATFALSLSQDKAVMFNGVNLSIFSNFRDSYSKNTLALLHYTTPPIEDVVCWMKNLSCNHLSTTKKVATAEHLAPMGLFYYEAMYKCMNGYTHWQQHKSEASF